MKLNWRLIGSRWSERGTNEAFSSLIETAVWLCKFEWAYELICMKCKLHKRLEMCVLLTEVKWWHSPHSTMQSNRCLLRERYLEIIELFRHLPHDFYLFSTACEGNWSVYRSQMEIHWDLAAFHCDCLAQNPMLILVWISHRLLNDFFLFN